MKPTKQQIRDAKAKAKAAQEATDIAAKRVREARAAIAELESRASLAWRERHAAERDVQLLSLTDRQLSALVAYRDELLANGVGPGTIRLLSDLCLIRSTSGWRGWIYVDGITDAGRALLAERGL